jgi:hypothetical protein
LYVTINPSIAAEDQNPLSSSLNAEKLASEAVIRLEKGLTVPTTVPTYSSLAISDATVNKSISDKSTQDRLTEEHQKAKDGGYDKDFHRAIKENGGTRLKEEWEKNCKSRVMNSKDARSSADLAEINCY